MSNHSTENDSFYVIRRKSDHWYILRNGSLYHDFKDSDCRFESWNDAFNHWAFEIDAHEILHVEARYELTIDKR